MKNHKLEIGKPITVKVSARNRHSIESLEAEKGQIYSFTIDSNNRYWVDAILPCTAKGWDAFFILDNKKRVPGYPLFHLCGNLDQDDQTAFAIGVCLQSWEAPRNGRVSFFANDYPSMYWNNWGSVSVIITRVS